MTSKVSKENDIYHVWLFYSLQEPNSSLRWEIYGLSWWHSQWRGSASASLTEHQSCREEAVHLWQLVEGAHLLKSETRCLWSGLYCTLMNGPSSFAFWPWLSFKWSRRHVALVRSSQGFEVPLGSTCPLPSCPSCPTKSTGLTQSYVLKVGFSRSCNFYV